jgi:hypothetical protein
MFSERVGKYLKGLLGALLPDLFMFGGLASMVWGIHMMSIPGAYIAGGAAAILVGLASGSSKA